jgi:hypothetical protein
MNVLEKAKLLFLNPGNFFKKMSKEGILQPIIFFSLVLLISQITSVLISFQTGRMEDVYISNGMANEFQAKTVEIFLMNVFMGWFTNFMFVFFVVMISHAVVKLLGGKNTFTKTYAACAYGLTPYFLFDFLSYLASYVNGILYVITFAFTYLWGLYLSTMGISEYHKISRFKSFTAVISPIVLTLILIYFFFASGTRV